MSSPGGPDGGGAAAPPVAAPTSVDKWSTPILGGENRFKLAVFAHNMAGGANLTISEDGPPRVDWPETRRIALAADRAGIEALVPVARWRGMGSPARPEGHRSFETFTWAAALAAVTERIQLFATFHVPTTHPVRAAKEVATVDHVAGGRFGVNVVAGWNEDEFAMFGLGQLAHDDRYAVADEWMGFLERVWAETGEFDFEGRYFRSKNVLSEPKPLQRPSPVVMGAGFSPAGRAFAAKHADVSFAILPSMEGAAEVVAATKAHAHDAFGRDLRVFGAAHVVCADTDASARRAYDDFVRDKGDWEGAENALRLLIPNSQSAEFDRGMAAAAIAGFFATPLVGTPERVVAGMAEMAEAGFDGVALSWFDYEEGVAQYAEVLRPLLVQAGLRRS